MPKLTDTQLVILSAAANRNTGAVMPLPKTLKANRGTANTIRSLIKRGLIAERGANAKDSIGREDGDARLTLGITDTGLAAIGIDATGAAVDADPATVPNRKCSKQSLLIGLLKRTDGASIDELRSALGWQAHSVRGAIAGAVKKKLGYAVMSEKTAARGRIYRIMATG